MIIKWIVVVIILLVVFITPIIVAIVLAADDPYEDFEAECKEFDEWYEEYKKGKKK